MEIQIEDIDIKEKLSIEDIEIGVKTTYPELENLVVTPTGEEQYFKSNMYGYDKVIVKGVEAEELNIIPSTEEQVKEGLYKKVTVPGASDLIPENIKEGIEIFGIPGSAKTTDIRITDASYLFYNGARLNYLNDFLDLCENVATAERMFYGCKNLEEIDLSDFNTENISIMSYMFRDCSKLTKLDLSNFNTENVTDMNSIFYGCSKLVELNLSNFNTENVTNISSMFYGCTALTEINLNNFNTKNVTTMLNMFQNCNNLTELDLSSFNTEKVTTTSNMFTGCTKLQTLDLSSFDFSKNTTPSGMFSRCTALTNLKSFKNAGKAFTSKTANSSNYKLDLSYCNNLTHESLIDVITNGLYDLNLTYDVANGGTLYRQQLVLGSTNLAKLTAEEIAIAEAKGWSVS